MTSSFYDPIGFFSPVILTAKVVLQDITRQNCSWDDPVSSEIRSKWLKWLSTLRNISDIKIGRCYTPVGFGDVKSKEIHYFCDASSSGYGAVSYMRLIDNSGRVHISFIMGKARLSPIKPVTIPRLELSAATLAVKMNTTVMDELRHDNKIDNIVFWTDSTTVLHYIRNHDKRYKIFVANRLATIHAHSTVSQWRYVTTTENPADHASRGLYGDDTTELNMWLQGPEFLKATKNDWPSQPDSLPLMDNTEVMNVNTHAVIHTPHVHSLEWLILHCSSWCKIKRLIAWLTKYKEWSIQRYINSDVNVNKEFSVTDLKSAETCAIKIVQQVEFIADYISLCKKSRVLQSSQLASLSPIMQDDIILLGGRLQRAPIGYNTRHQAILPNKHNITDAVIRHCHIANAHAGVEDTLAHTRQKYWIIKGKSAVKRVVSRCQLCRRYNAHIQQQIMAPLPLERLEPYKPPFTYIGIDYFGPLKVKQRRSYVKRWGCIFVCLTMRAVHIEIAHSLDTDSFLCCLQRFMNRRGKPEKIYSDNGTNFTSGEKELKQCIIEWNTKKISKSLAQQHIEWHFNPPAASHMGGVWERLIRSTKNILRKILHQQIVNDEVLITVMTEAERVMNDRPLIKASSDSKDDHVITPNSLLMMKQAVPGPIHTDVNVDYTRRRWRQSQHISNVFWRKWILQYLPCLQSRQKWCAVKENLKVNDVCADRG